MSVAPIGSPCAAKAATAKASLIACVRAFPVGFASGSVPNLRRTVETIVCLIAWGRCATPRIPVGLQLLGDVFGPILRSPTFATCGVDFTLGHFGAGDRGFQKFTDQSTKIRDELRRARRPRRSQNAAMSFCARPATSRPSGVGHIGGRDGHRHIAAPKAPVGVQRIRGGSPPSKRLRSEPNRRPCRRLCWPCGAPVP